MNAQLDALLDSYFKTLPIPQRTEVLGKIVYQVADQVTGARLYYLPIPGAFSNRLVNVSQQWPGVFITWNAHQWDVRS
jgi:hypothetical protein